MGAGLLAKAPFAFAQDTGETITKGDAAILRFLAAAEIIESDLPPIKTDREKAASLREIRRPESGIRLSLARV
jgi:hypothetical protein